MSSDSIDLSGSRHTEFLQKLAKDDDFRAAVEADPKAAFAAHGIQLDPNLFFHTKVVLPSKEELRGHLDSYIDRMTTLEAQMAFLFKS